MAKEYSKCPRCGKVRVGATRIIVTGKQGKIVKNYIQKVCLSCAWSNVGPKLPKLRK
jgi:predicted nucleic-acid-binding Zn-ribbon protein